MSYQALARKYRPRSFPELVGQKSVRRALENALDSEKLHPALLFSGTRGVGKTTLGRIVARCLNCERGVSASPCGECPSCREIEAGRFVDLIEVDAASRTKVDETRELLDNVQYAPTRGRRKVYLIDEVHMLSRHSFNALLKTLEEPPPHAQFLLATTDPQKLPVTILSRCLQFHLKRIPEAEIAARLREILELEELQADDDGIRRLARAADGSLRDALSLLDQAIAHGGGAIRGDDVAEMLGSIERHDVQAIVEALADADPQAAWAAMATIDEMGRDFGEALDELARLFQQLAVVQLLPGEELDDDPALRALAARIAPQDLQVYYQLTVNARRDLDWAPDPRSGFEMCVLRLFAFAPAGAGEQTRAAPPAAHATPAAGAGSATAADAGAAAATPRDVTPAPPPAAPAADADWPELMAALKLRGPALQLARHCVISSREGERLCLSLDAAGQAMRTASAESRLREAASKQLGVELTLVEAPVDKATPAQLQARQVEAKQRDAESTFLGDPAVRELQAEFGAEVVAGSVRALGPDAGEAD